MRKNPAAGSSPRSDSPSLKNFVWFAYPFSIPCCGVAKHLLPARFFAGTLRETKRQDESSQDRISAKLMAISGAQSSTVAATETTSGGKGALAMVITLFFLWGFITCLNDILIPHLKSVFTLSYAEVMLVQTFFFSGYFVFALPSGKVLDWIGYKATMVAGLLIMAAGAVCFIPAATVPSFPLFLVALAIVAAGMTFLQVAANPYVIVLGPAKTASSRLNLAQAFNSLERRWRPTSADISSWLP